MISSDLQLREHAQAELEWEPQVNPAAIGIAVKDAVVTLSGYVDSYGEKHAAAEAIARIHGVRAVANEIAVRLPADDVRSDADIAHAIALVFNWDTVIPDNRIRVEVSQGWVTLQGSVEWQFERTAAEAAVRGMLGVKGITNAIVVKPSKTKVGGKSKLEYALSRSTADTGSDIEVMFKDGVVTLSGLVLSFAIRDVLESVAWRTPGVVHVQNDLQVEPIEIVELAEFE